ncbi:hypothetical protein ANFP_02900 [Acidithiobacillus ferrooxidans]|nr:hypothetical protein ANFP_02900 [Acidithiobacillus ferrooxidans]
MDRGHVPPMADVWHLHSHPPVRRNTILPMATDEALPWSQMDVLHQIPRLLTAPENGPRDHPFHWRCRWHFP